MPVSALSLEPLLLVRDVAHVAHVVLSVALGLDARQAPLRRSISAANRLTQVGTMQASCSACIHGIKRGRR